MKQLSQVLSEYFLEHRALPAFNIDCFEIYQAIEIAVSETKLPCLIQLSSNEDVFIQAERLFMLVKKAQIDGLPIYLNMDHGQDLLRLQQLVNLGYDMVHFDGSTLDYQDNLRQATEFIRRIRVINPAVIVEAEFNHINLVNADIAPDSFTSPDQAKEFIDTTQANLLAVSIGNFHGVNLDRPEHLDLDLLSQIHQQLPNSWLTLHGGSGVNLPEIKQAIDLGVVKININTDLRLAFRQSLTANLTNSSSEKVYDYLNPVISDLKNIIVKKLTQFSHS